MAQSTSNAVRADPYGNFKFVVSWDGQPVAGVSMVSGLARDTQPVEHREGADPATTPAAPGQTPAAPITLERGVTHDPAFADWASRVWSARQSGSPPAQTPFVRRDLGIALYNDAGQKVIAYDLYRCWPSDFVSLGDLDGDGVVIQRLVLQVEGWERDTSVAGPAAATFPDTPPAG